MTDWILFAVGLVEGVLLPFSALYPPLFAQFAAWCMRLDAEPAPRSARRDTRLSATEITIALAAWAFVWIVVGVVPLSLAVMLHGSAIGGARWKLGLLAGVVVTLVLRKMNSRRSAVGRAEGGPGH